MCQEACAVNCVPSSVVELCSNAAGAAPWYQGWVDPNINAPLLRAPHPACSAQAPCVFPPALPQALLAREDQAGGRKRVGAAMLTLFSSSIKLVGKMRIRLSTLPANVPLNLSMPLQGERSDCSRLSPYALLIRHEEVNLRQFTRVWHGFDGAQCVIIMFFTHSRSAAQPAAMRWEPRYLAASNGSREAPPAWSVLLFFSGGDLCACLFTVLLYAAAAPLHVPALGERTNLRAGQACAATAHLYLQLVVPNLLGRYLPAYARFSVCSPALYLLSTSPAVAGPDSTLEALAGEVQATTARCVCVVVVVVGGVTVCIS